MPSLSPSPMKRPSMSERTGSNASLSSSIKQSVHKVHRRPAHGRNLSHGKNLSKLGKINSSTNVVAEAVRNHQRKKSEPPSPPTSPGMPLMKRNTSHATLPKNTSHANLRKNKSATTLARNTSHNALKKLGLPPPPKQKDKTTNEVGFELGDPSEEEEEAEWEDSTVSPEITRNNSKASTPARAGTPSQELPNQRPLNYQFPAREKTSSPPAPSIKNNNRSAPNFNNTVISLHAVDPPQEPALLQNNPRSSRAPPAMSSILAHAKPGHLQRSSSSRSFTHINHKDVDSDPSPAGEHSLSAEGGVSHFLSTSTPINTPKLGGDDGSDSDSPSNFLPNYHPQQSQSPEKTKTLNKSKSNLPSRTQQRQELQRREMMRAGAMPATTPPAATVAFGFGSAVSLHGRSGSRGRSLAEDAKLMRLNYEAATKQLGVVRRFRDPELESLRRLKDSVVLPSDIGIVASGARSRPQSRRGRGSIVNGVPKSSAGTSPEDRKLSQASSGRPSRVHFQRQGSHDDIGLSRSRGSYEENENDLHDGMTEEEALIRRIWDSRELPIYDRVEAR